MIFERVKHIVSQQFDVAEEEIELDTDFREDLEADSLDLVELVMELEDEFETEVDDSEIEDI
ncbi:MAG TPA: acyl carrier protein, partial [Tissierellaceae bacterium]